MIEESEQLLLSEIGHPYVTMRAATAVAVGDGLGEEEARRWITARSIDARERSRLHHDYRSFRRRWTEDGRRVELDLSVVVDGPLVVIVHAEVRRSRRSRGRRDDPR